MKWLHRQFRWIIPFGRSCLIPNLRFATTLILEPAYDLKQATYLRLRLLCWTTDSIFTLSLQLDWYLYPVR